MRSAVVLATAIVAAACQRPRDNPDIQAARAAVLRYDERLPAAYRTGDQNQLGNAADEAETGRVGAVIAGLARRGEVMIARLLDVQMQEAKILDKGLVAVETVETWVYEHRALTDPGRPVAAKRGVYRMTYQVGLHAGAWRVQAATVSEERESR